MNGDQLPLQVSCEFRRFYAAGGQYSSNLIAIRAAFCRTRQVEKAGIPAGNLHAFVAKRRSPTGNLIKSVKRSSVTGKLGEKNGWPLSVFTVQSPWTITVGFQNNWKDTGRSPI